MAQSRCKHCINVERIAAVMLKVGMQMAGVLTDIKDQDELRAHVADAAGIILHHEVISEGALIVTNN